MKANLMALTLSVILVAGMSIMPALGQSSDQIMVTTDKESYSEGETIVITGEVSQLLSGQPASIRVMAPNGNVVYIAQPDIDADRKFSTELIAGGPLMKAEGTYTINVLYGGPTRTAQTTFMFGGSTDQGDDRMTGMTSVTIDPELEPITYSITGGEVISIEPQLESKSLLIKINATDDGSLEISIPRTILEATNEMDGTDDDYFVLVDREEVDFDENKTDTHRTLTIEFSAGAEEIEIIGKWVIPEFGTIAVMILAVSIIAIIAVSARTKLGIIPRY